LLNLLFFIIPTFSGSFVSMPRYILLCLSCFITLGRYLNNHKVIRVLYVIISIYLQIIYTSLFARGFWVS
jgi:hypothetical protein